MLGETLNLLVSTQSQHPQRADLGTNLAFGQSPRCPFWGQRAHFGDGLAAILILGVKIGNFGGPQAARVATVSRFGEILLFLGAAPKKHPGSVKSALGLRYKNEPAGEKK